jgi:hypothetical protein
MAQGELSAAKIVLGGGKTIKVGFKINLQYEKLPGSW